MTPDPELTGSEKKRLNLSCMIIVVTAVFLLCFWVYTRPRKCYCAGQPIDCKMLKDMREALRVNELSQDGLRNCYGD